MKKNGQIMFRYCDERGNISQEANPNGATDAIAGVCNAKKNVFGMMPHPERAADSNLSNEDGLLLFQSLLSTIFA
jgi:phosphoribosylformylglycinamidine synthase